MLKTSNLSIEIISSSAQSRETIPLKVQVGGDHFLPFSINASRVQMKKGRSPCSSAQCLQTKEMYLCPRWGFCRDVIYTFKSHSALSHNFNKLTVSRLGEWISGVHLHPRNRQTDFVQPFNQLLYSVKSVRQQQQNKLNLSDCGLKLAWSIYFIYAKITTNLEVLLLTFYKYCNIYHCY